MQSESSIYITVISDASTDRYPSNTPSKFKVDLSQPIILEGIWQVALTEIHISNNWYDISEDCSLDVEFEASHNRNSSFKSLNSSPSKEREEIEEEVDDVEQEQYMFSVYFQKKSFPSLSHLCLYLSNEISKQIPDKLLEILPQSSVFEPSKPLVDFQIDQPLGHVRILPIKSVYVSLRFFNFSDIFTILSLDLSDNNSYDLPIEGDHPASLCSGSIGLFVLCNVINFQNVGNSQMRLLRMMPIKSSDRREDRHSHYLPNPYYITCIISYIETIEFELRKDNNQLPIFPQRSRIILVLHFKRKLAF